MCFRDWQKSRVKHHLPALPFDHYTELVNSLMCFPPTMDCRMHVCNDCGLKGIKDFLVAAEKDEGGLVYEWEVFEKDANGHLAIITKQGPPSEMARHAKVVFTLFAYHRFLVKHQQTQCNLIAINLPFRYTIGTRDYAEKPTLVEKWEMQT
jgi:hypothetical protein